MRKKKVPIPPPALLPTVTPPSVTVTVLPTPTSPAFSPAVETRIPVEIDGRTYDLSFALVDLAQAERLFRSQGHKVNLLVALPELTLESVREVFPCAAHRYHPDLTFEQAQALVTMQSVYPIATAIVQAWNEASSKNAAPANAVAGE
jgi:hypothetical protein